MGANLKIMGWKKTILASALSIGVLSSTAAAEDKPTEPTKEVHNRLFHAARAADRTGLERGSNRGIE
jgi:hypothetical protein